METEDQVTELLVESNEKENNSERAKLFIEQDMIFCDLIYAILQDIPDSEDKDLMKLNIQQIIIKRKYQR